MSTTTETNTQVRAKITVPADVMEQYERIAFSERKPLDQVLSERLTQCATHKAQKGIWLGDADRMSIEEATHSNISTASDLVGLVRKAMRIRVGGTDIPLGEVLLDRLRSRCFDPNFEKWLAKHVIEGLQEYVGLR